MKVSTKFFLTFSNLQFYLSTHLLKIWNRIKNFGEDLGKIAILKIIEFIESKYNPARPLKITEERLRELQKKYGKTDEQTESGKKGITNETNKESIKSKLSERGETKPSFNSIDKIIELILFIGGTFIFVVSLSGGYYSRGGSNSLFKSPFSSGFSSSSGFEVWSVIGMAIGISMIVFGFLRRSWNKQEKGNK